MTESLFESINEAFSQYMQEFKERIMLSQSNLTNALDKLEKKMDVSKYYCGVHDTYLENKDIVNEFILMIFGEIKSTLEANFQIFKEQLGYLQSSVINELNKSNKTFQTSFNELQKHFFKVIKNFASNTEDGLNQFKKSKANSIDLLSQQIRTNITLNETTAFSELKDVMQNFTEGFSKELKKINQKLKDQFKIFMTELDDKLVAHQKETEKQYSELLNKYEDKVNETITLIEEYLKTITIEQEEISKEFNTEFLDTLNKEKAEFDEEIKKIISSTQDGYKNYRNELVKLTKNKSKVQQVFNDKILKFEAKFNDLLKKKKKDDPLYDEIKDYINDILEQIENIKQDNQNYQEELNKIDEKGLNDILKDKDSSLKILNKISTSLKNKIIIIQKELNKRINAITKDFGLKIQDLSSKSDLISTVKDLIKDFREFGKKYMDNLSKFKKLNSDVLKKGLNGLVSINNEAFSSFDKLLIDDVADFVNNLETHTMTNLEKMKTIATEIITESSSLATLDIPEFDQTFNNLVKIFEENIKETQAKYQKIIQENYGPLFSSVDDIILKIKKDISQFENEQKKLLEINMTSHNKFLNVINKTYNMQFKEFEDRIDADIISLVDANQEIIGKIMIKTAETGSDFYDKSQKTSKKTEKAVNEFLTQLKKSVNDFTNDFNATTERIKDLIIVKLTQTTQK